MRLRSWLLPFVVVPGLCLGGCGDPAPASGGALRLAVVPKGTAHAFWNQVHAGAAAAARDLGVEIDWQGPQPSDNREAQIRLVENFVTARVAGIVLAPCDQRALVAPVEAAARAGVPTVVIDSGLETDQRVAFIATDNHAGGVLAAEHLGKLLGGKGRIVVLRFLEGSASTMAREAGFLETLRVKFPGIEVVSDNQYGGAIGTSRSTAEALLLAHPEIDGAFCPNESTVQGMLGALEATGRAGKVVLVGFDGNAVLEQGLVSGHVHGLVLQDPVGMGRRGVEVLVAHLRGEAVAKEEQTALLLATPENRGEPAVAKLLHPDLSILGK